MDLAKKGRVATVAGLLFTRRMTLSSLLTVGQIIPEMTATERWPAITEIVDLLVARDRIQSPYRDSILAALRQREETMSTGIGFGIAIPHASSEHVTEVVAESPRTEPRASDITRFLAANMQKYPARVTSVLVGGHGLAWQECAQHPVTTLRQCLEDSARQAGRNGRRSTPRCLPDDRTSAIGTSGHGTTARRTTLFTRS